MYPNNHSQTQNANVNNVGAIRNRHLRILIVDDEPRFRQSMSFNLRRKYDAEVTDVGSGEEAVKTLRDGEEFDIIFLDLMMPGMNGTQTYLELKNIDANCSIVMMSAHSDSKEWAKAEQLDVELLSKPIAENVLNQILLHVPNR
jgi:CheY-like chemotaxis protein